MVNPQTSEIVQRRQICSRINELKSSCEKLTKIRDDLSIRLSKLNEVVDQLIAEKSVKKYDPHLKIDLTTYHIIDSIEPSKSYKYHREQTSPTMTTGNTGSSRHNNNPSQKPSSDAFKIKLFHCLREIAPKAKEIVEISERL